MTNLGNYQKFSIFGAEKDEMIMTKNLCLTFCAFLLFACSSGINPYDDRIRNFTETDQSKIKALLQDPDQLRRFLSGTTKRAPHPSFTQIGYFSPSGQYFLAYPGNTSVVQGRWSVSERGRLCFSYWNEPWDCSHIQPDLTADTAQIVDGDVLNLSRRKNLPRPIPRNRGMTIEEVMSWFGLKSRNLVNKVGWNRRS
ncbi:DUF995 domain-containing protein [Phaeobacter piscinae]|uniref:DUF995 domain-containing protein n=1 Tax=Phaeobacter piscinae TaxID=1580596 RepID=UPI000F492876|nr:DUF995 domain-containing protein [Phaeobacter piscinae]